MADLPRGVVTFVFTDLQGSTRLFQRLGDAYLPVLDRHNQLIRLALDRHRGHEVKTEGDAFFASFADPADALAACLDAQRLLAGEPWPDGVEIAVRMGVHLGPVHVVDDDYVGMSVHEAARLAAAGHGGQVLCSAVVRDGVADRLPAGASLRELGAHGLKDLPEAMLILQLDHPDLAPTFPPLRTLTATRHGLPSPSTSLVGREEVLERAQRLLLDGSRLVVVTGEGGIGKSRFALEVAWSVLSWFPGGAWWVPLSAATTADEVLSAVVAAVGADPRATDPIDAIATALGTGRTLLVLDNTEQLGDEVVVAADLLDRLPGVTVLATSRDRLRLSAERRVALDPLDAGAAARLFVDRARAAIGEAPTVDQATLDELLDLLAGMPLAIELAAARLDGMEARALLAGLRGSLALLDEGARDLPPRHRALRSALAWSVDLASPTARAAYVALGAFVGGATDAAVAAVLGWPDAAATGALDEVVEAALARRADPGRVWQLEPLRQHAAELLAADPALLARTHTAHAAAMAALAAALAPQLLAGDQAAAAAALDADDANLVVALHRGSPHQALAMATDAMRAWIARGRWTEGRARLLAAHDRAGADADPRRRAQALLGAGHLAHRQGDLTAAAEQLASAASALVLDGELLDVGLAANIANQRAEVARLSGRLDEAAAGYVAALAMAEQAGDGRMAASVQMSQAALATHRSDLATAIPAWIRAHDAFAAVGDAASALQCAALVARHGGPVLDVEEVRRWATLALEGARAQGVLRAEADADLALAQLAPPDGPPVAVAQAFEERAAHFDRAAELFAQLGDEHAASGARGNAAMARLGAGDVAGARRALLALVTDPATPTTTVGELLQILGPAAATAAAAGRPQDAEALVAYAEVLDAIDARLLLAPPGGQA